mmetsp:Transcript_68371/g.142526  ORF Transcript_68371/g.142526 Transcript_68371/m.142526 type:complete len:243 (+) Transcript_68371:492-1220(+)
MCLRRGTRAQSTTRCTITETKSRAAGRAADWQPPPLDSSMVPAREPGVSSPRCRRASRTCMSVAYARSLPLLNSRSAIRGRSLGSRPVRRWSLTCSCSLSSARGPTPSPTRGKGRRRTRGSLISSKRYTHLGTLHESPHVTATSSLNRAPLLIDRVWFVGPHSYHTTFVWIQGWVLDGEGHVTRRRYTTQDVCRRCKHLNRRYQNLETLQKISGLDTSLHAAVGGWARPCKRREYLVCFIGK